MENIKVRKVNREDSRRIWEIRNHPLMRQNSNSQEETPFEKHDQWFENKYFKTDKNYCFVLENKEGEVIGYCRIDFDSSENNYVVSIAIDVNYHGKGLGPLLLNKAIDLAGIKKNIIAQTFKKNIYSQKVFEKNNFEIYKEDNNSYYFKLKNNL